jgi:large subunit ribosomal protein L13
MSHKGKLGHSENNLMRRSSTYFEKPIYDERQWNLVDATGQVLGRMATQIARKLQGKHRPGYTPHAPNGDYVVVVNASKLRVTGKKLVQKIYYRHSGYTGNLKSIRLKELISSRPDQVVRLAVKGMLPDSVQGRRMLNRLKVYSGGSHPHAAQLKEETTKE